MAATTTASAHLPPGAGFVVLMADTAGTLIAAALLLQHRDA